MKPLSLFVFFFALARERTFIIKTHGIKSRCVIRARKIYCLQARPCIFQPGNFTGWGSERVNSLCFDLENAAVKLGFKSVLLILPSEEETAPLPSLGRSVWCSVTPVLSRHSMSPTDHIACSRSHGVRLCVHILSRKSRQPLRTVDSSVVRAPDSGSKGRGFESRQERRENFLLRGQLSVLTLISVSVPPPCYRSGT